MILSPLSLQYKLDLLLVLRILAELLGLEVKEVSTYAPALARQEAVS